ncbi:MAG: 30S ribosomal protein S8 [Alistipes finegoldii]
MTDPIADFLTGIRNAVKANHKVVEAPVKIKQEITDSCERATSSLTNSTPKKVTVVKIAQMGRTTEATPSRTSARGNPGRQYVSVADTRVLNSLGIAVLSTSARLTDAKARKKTWRRGAVLHLLTEILNKNNNVKSW